MKIYDLTNDTGRIYAFEVRSLLLSRSRACAIAGGVPGVYLTRSPRRWRFREPDDFCKFQLDGFAFVISEHFGDNSRYWIGPQPLHAGAPLGAIRHVFASAPTWPLLRAR